MSKKHWLIIIALSLGVVMAPKMSWAITNGFNLTNLNLVNIGSFKTSWLNVLSSVKARLSPFSALKPSGWCKDKIEYCDSNYRQSVAQCAPKKNICLSSSNSLEFCEQLVKDCTSQAVQTQAACKKAASLDARCWLVVPEGSCQGAESRACTAATGLPGTQTAVSCNTTTGQWNWGECVANTPPPPTPAPAPTCTPLSPQTQTVSCPAGQTGAITQQRTSSCPGPTWSEWSTISDSCQTAPPGVCTSFTYSNWSACTNGTQTRTVLSALPSGCEGGTPITTQSCTVTCTSFTYSAWSACVSPGTQTRTVTASSPSGCTGGSPVLSQSCTVPCTGSQPACGLGYVGSYTCVDGNWQNNCQVACSQPPPACASGWSGNYSCMLSGSGYVWMNTCVPPGTPGCYRGVSYILYTSPTGAQKTYVKCDGQGYTVNGNMCLINDCGPYQPWNDFGSFTSFTTYTDTILNKGYKTYINSSSCSQQNHVYTQC